MCSSFTVPLQVAHSQCTALFGHQMEAADGEGLDQFVAPPVGNRNELLNVDQEDNMQGQVSSADLRDAASLLMSSGEDDSSELQCTYGALMSCFCIKNNFLSFFAEVEEFLGPQADYNEEEEEKKYYRRKRLGVIKNVLAASVGAMIVYSVYLGEFL